jgi:transcriptional regulator with XRE-family HTH domain
MTPPRHAVDLHNRRHLIATLRNLRLRHGMSQQDIADDLYLTHGAVSRFERKTDNPMIHTVQRYARALDHRLVMYLVGIAGTAANQTADPTTQAAGQSPGQIDRACRSQPDRGDNHATATLLAQLVAARHALGLRQRDVADRMGTTHSAVCDLETDPRAPRLSTYQRYARALDLRLACRIVPAPVVDIVKVDKVHAGQERFGNLTAAEQVALFRRYGHTDTGSGLQDRWSVSGARFHAIAALAVAELVEAA